MNKIIYIVGLPNSGKTTLLNLFRLSGHNVLELDKLVAPYYEFDHPIAQWIFNYNPNFFTKTKLNRNKFGKYFFTNTEFRENLNKLFFDYISKYLSDLKGVWIVESGAIGYINLPYDQYAIGSLYLTRTDASIEKLVGTKFPYLLDKKGQFVDNCLFKNPYTPPKMLKIVENFVEKCGNHGTSSQIFKECLELITVNTYDKQS